MSPFSRTRKGRIQTEYPHACAPGLHITAFSVYCAKVCSRVIVCLYYVGCFTEMHLKSRRSSQSQSRSISRLNYENLFNIQCVCDLYAAQMVCIRKKDFLLKNVKQIHKYERHINQRHHCDSREH